MANKKQGGTAFDAEARTPLQAIVLADSFAQKFRPITLEKPKVLLPLVNIPMIDYTLEWLSSAGVEEVLVFCCAHANKVEKYLQGSQWRARPGFKVTTVISNKCTTAGDAMRLLDGQSVVRGDFILVSGDTVSNMSLTEVLEQHQERRKVDKRAVMTMVTKRVQTSKVTMQSRLGNDEQLFVLDTDTKQLLHYDHGRDYGKGDAWNKPVPHSLRIDMDLFAGRQSIDLRTDLQDCHIDICAPEVLFLFTDNFDYQHIRRDFVKGLLSDEISGNKIYTYELRNEYAARIDNLRAYDAVSRDVMSRWTYPLVPDTCFSDCITKVMVGRMNICKEEGVEAAQSAKLGPNVFVGEGTKIGENTIVRNSVVGKNCTIGDNVRIENSYVWDRVRIDDRVQVLSSMVCDGVHIEPKVILEPGTVLSFNVVIGESFRVKGWSKISRMPQTEEKSSSDDELEYATAGSAANSPPKAHFPEHEFSDLDLARTGTDRVLPYKEPEVGVGGAGFRWSTREDEDEFRLSIAPIPEKHLRLLREKAEKLALVAGDHPALFVKDSHVGAGLRTAGSQPFSTTEQAQDGEDESEEEQDRDEDFYNEVAATFRRAVFEGVTDNNVKLEILGLRSGYNKSFANCGSGVFRAMIDVVFERFPHANQGELKTSIAKVIGKWGPLLNMFLLDLEDQVEVLLTLEELCEEGKHREQLTPIFSEVVHGLYNFDVVTEDSVMMWVNEKSGGTEADRFFVKQCDAFIKWLETAEEEDSDDEPPPPKKPAAKPAKAAK